jgi:hypothetical protein
MNLGKLCAGLCALAIATTSTFAATKTTPEIIKLTLSPAHPVQGDVITAFVEVSQFTSSQPINTLVQATLDGASALPLLHPSDSLWIAQLGSFGDIADHQLSLSASIQDAQDAKAIQAQITVLDTQIASLQDQIRHAVSDPDLVTKLTAELKQAQDRKTQLTQALADTSKVIDSETFAFSIEPKTQLQVVLEETSFGARLKTPQSKNVTVKNTSLHKSAKLVATSFSNDTGDFSTNLQLPTTLQPEQVVTFQLTYKPTLDPVPTTPVATPHDFTVIASDPSLNITNKIQGTEYSVFPLTLKQVFATALTPTEFTIGATQPMNLYAIYDQESDFTATLSNSSNQDLAVPLPTPTPVFGQFVSTIQVKAPDPNPNCSVVFQVIPTPFGQIAQTENYLLSQMTWDFNLLPNTGVDAPLTFSLSSYRLANIGTPTINSLDFGTVTASNPTQAIPFPLGSFSSLALFPAFDGSSQVLFVPPFQWWHHVNDFEITGPDAAAFSTTLFTGNNDQAVPKTFDFGRGDDTFPSAFYQAFPQFNLTLHPIAGHVAQYSANLHIMIDGLSTPVDVPITANVQPPTPPAPVVEINAGGPSYTGSDGTTWGADADFSGGTPFTTTASITGTSDPTLYQTVHFGNTFSYTFAVPNGNYSVALKFAEIFWTAANQRVFNVSINGTPALSNFDIFTPAGNAANKAVDETFPVTVTSGQIVIQFTSTVDNACVAGIRIANAR